MIPYGRQEITQEDINAVVNVLQSDLITQGTIGPQFEQAVANYVGAKYGIAMNSATSCLHLACLALGLGKGDWLWTSAISFVASANCGLYCGAQVDFVDIDLDTLNICVKALAEKLEIASVDGRLPKILVVVHMAGFPARMEEIDKLSKRYGFKVIEDASHAIGARYKQQYVGSCKHSDVVIFSFHPVKIITTAEGGMALTNSTHLRDRLSLLRSHGITRDKECFQYDNYADWYYEQQELGYNYRLNEIQAALGLSQLARLNKYVSKREEIANIYQLKLAGMNIQLPPSDAFGSSSWHLYLVQLSALHGENHRNRVFDRLRSSGVGVNVHYIPIYLHPYYRNLGFSLGHCPNAEMYFSRTLSLPIFPTMTSEQQTTVIDALKLALSK